LRGVAQFLGGIAGYNPRSAGTVMILSALPILILIPILPRIIGKVDPRLTAGLGVSLFAVSCFVDIGLSPDSAGDDFTASQLLRGVGQILASMPLNMSSMAAIGPESAADGAGIFNMARNLGGSIGLALSGILIEQRTALHSDAIRESVTNNSLLGQARLAASGLAQGLDNPTAKLRAIASLSGQIDRSALVMAFSDCFWTLGVILVAIVPLVVLLHKPRPDTMLPAEH
jgi:DHA2 family multidrug resistance protein